jgi:asparagine synthase (glutamine-hydrolysing)
VCGFLAVVGVGIEPNGVIAAIRHRGPDDEGCVERMSRLGPVTLVSTRLAIRDLSPMGHMPMPNDDGSVVLSYNGELYNAAELRREVEQAGFTVRSSGDTELVLRAYEAFGVECVHHFEGMFAFAIWDAREEQLFIARDHFGVKPLYYGQRGDVFACGSEVKALLGVPGFRAEVDPVALQQYLTFLWVPDPLTMFEGIFKLEAGHYGIFRGGRFTTHQYWDLSFPPAGHVFPRSEEDLVAEFRERFFDSVKRQMVSDVPLGAFLSAGLDSSSIVAAMAHAGGQSPRTFTIGLGGRGRGLDSDELSVARLTAKHFGCDHHEIIVEPDIAELLPRLVWHMDEPIAGGGPVMSYLVNREARPHVTVLMSGTGGDELLAGYRKHWAQFSADTYRRLPEVVRRRLIEPGIERIPSMVNSRVSAEIRLLKKMARSASLPAEDRFIRNGSYLDRAGLSGLLAEPHRELLVAHDPWVRHRGAFATVAGAEELNRLLYVDTKAFLGSMLLYGDKMSMAASTEVRVPFLDRRLAEFMAWQVPTSMKLNGRRRPTTKYLLRKALGEILPPGVMSQRKSGFGGPAAQWIAGPLRPMVDDLLAPSVVSGRGWFEPAVVSTMVADHRAGRDDLSLQIWALLTFELWQRAFTDASPGDFQSWLG